MQGEKNKKQNPAHGVSHHLSSLPLTRSVIFLFSLSCFFFPPTCLIFLFRFIPALDLKSELFTLFIPSPRPIVVVYLTKKISIQYPKAMFQRLINQITVTRKKKEKKKWTNARDLQRQSLLYPLECVCMFALVCARVFPKYRIICWFWSRGEICLAKRSWPMAEPWLE